MAATIRSGICALYWFVIAFVIVSFLSVPVQASVLHFLNSFRCVCADSVLNDFIGRILQMDFHMLPVLLVGFSGTEGGSDFVNSILDPEGNFFASGKENKYTNSHSCL